MEDLKICSNCKHGGYDDNYPDTTPSIYKCYNEKSDMESPAWCSTCEYFEFDVQKLGEDISKPILRKIYTE